MDPKMCDQLIEYLNGHMNDTEKMEFEAHMEECPDCLDECKEMQELMTDLPYLSEPAAPPEGMKERVLSTVFDSEEIESSKAINKPDTERKSSAYRSRRNWISGVLAAGLVLSLGANAYLLAQNNEKQQALEEKVSQTYVSVNLAPQDSKSSGTASMVKGKKGMNLVVQTKDMVPVKGKEAYQVWLIEGEKKFRAGTFVPDKKGNGTVVFDVDYPGEHNWDAVAVSHEPTAKSEQPKGSIVLLSKL
ncbi:anti-sigma factor [Fictibacillus fluitans]|uniref:Anti-sigma-W factor RsiW n=1 Tax=Fictibacillus fluitans TaxID=3058422 RepID=A0ABT8HVK3_9BACL|nr:anti-sigma factor [Fictibacillus sp. NE201]MDN4524297.1 anti-sigma factor [Fictibacillus sp. NE201]